MTLTGSYVLPTNRIPEIFNKIRDGQAPERFSNQLLKDWGFTSTNDRAFIPLLKSLGFCHPMASQRNDITIIVTTPAQSK